MKASKKNDKKVTRRRRKARPSKSQLFVLHQKYADFASEQEDTPFSIGIVNRHGYIEINEDAIRKVFHDKFDTAGWKNTPSPVRKVAHHIRPETNFQKVIRLYRERNKRPRRKAVPLPRYKRLSSWRSLTHIETIFMLQRTLDSETKGVAITAHTSLDKNKLFDDKPNEYREEFKRDLSRYLKSAFNRDVDYWLAIDIDKNGQPHFHGTIDLKMEDQDLLEKVLLKASGVTDKAFTKYAFEVKRIDVNKGGGAGWVEYSTKRIDKIKQDHNLDRAYITTHGVTRKAKDLYERERSMINKVAKSLRYKASDRTGITTP